MAKKVKYPYDYDPKKRELAKIYSRIKIIAGIVNGIIIPILFLLAFFYLGLSFQLKSLVGESLFLVPLYVFSLLLLLTVIAFPLRFYSGHVYEHKYNLSKQTKKEWFKDYLKEQIVGYVFSIPVLTIVYFLMGFQHWWVYAAILYFFLDVFMDTIYPVMILPLFYKLKPFENKRLKTKLLNMAKKVGAKNIENVLIAKESEKSVKPNAMFAGIGKTKKMVLFDTLLDSFTEDEVETVIGHELGHYVHKDIWKGTVLGTILLFPIFFIIHLLLSSTLGLAGVNDIAGLPLFLAGFSIIELVLMPVTNSYSRRMERQADWFGLEASKKPKAQISTEKRLADLALSDDKPHPLVELFLYSHPSAEKRIRMVKEWENKQ